MSENKTGDIIPSSGGFVRDLTQRLKLILRLMGDNRVNPLIKLIPVGSLVYLVFPADVPGPIDDAAIIWLGMYMFVELCPPDVVEEHLQALQGKLSGQTGRANRSTNPAEPPDDDVIDGEVREV